MGVEAVAGDIKPGSAILRITKLPIRYDIQLVDEDGDSYTKWNVLITPNARIVFTIGDLD